MILVAGLLAVALPVTVWLLLRSHAEQAAAWAQERRELLTRIQRPEMLPREAAPQYIVPEPEPDDVELVNTIRYEP